MALAAPPSQTLVVFGASGDLARRKLLPALYDLAYDGLLPERSPRSQGRSKYEPLVPVEQ